MGKNVRDMPKQPGRRRAYVSAAILGIGIIAAGAGVYAIWSTTPEVHPAGPGASLTGQQPAAGEIGPPPVAVVVPAPSSADADAANPGEPPAGAAAPAAATSNELDPAESPVAADRVAPAEQVPAAPAAPESQSAAPPPTAPQSSGAAVDTAAPVPGTPPVVESGGWVVQLSAQRTEAEAESAFRGMQTKYSMLGSYQPLIRKKELGQRGVFYAAQVGPLAREEANQLCDKLKRAGGSCFVQRN